jgi:Permuted papain-like amidase enzyme, YaeF/YiiX, C92 family
MASNQDLLKSPKVTYQALRDTVKSGDILFYSGEDEVSKLIRWATHSIWSHIGIIVKIDKLNRVLLLESVENMGVRLIPLSKYIKNIEEYADEEKFDARLVIARHRLLSSRKIKKMLSFGIDQITRPYDHHEIQRIIQRIIAGEGKANRDRAFMCSELVYECLSIVDIEIAFNPMGFISPEDIWTNPHIEVIAEIEHG